MLNLIRGQRESVQKLCSSLEFDLEIYHKSNMEIDCVCFGLDQTSILSDEEYFLFYNHNCSPNREIELLPTTEKERTRFHFQLEHLPEKISRISIAAAIDGSQTMRELSKGYCRILKDQTEYARFSYSGEDFIGERALVICEIYRRNGEWRFCGIGKGFNGGLQALVENYGGSVLPSDSTVTAQKAESISGQHVESILPSHILKRIENCKELIKGETEYLREIYKSAFAGLALFPEAVSRSTKVVMCADVSGSMFELYRNGRVQRIIDKFFPFATLLSEEMQMDFWAFGAKSRQFSPVTMDNVRNYTFEESGGFERWMSMVNYQYSNECEAMRDLMMIYGGLREPVMILFLTDGRLSAEWEMEEILIKTSRFPLFWQFVGVHGEEYGMLEQVEQLDGRYSKNAGFFKVNDIDDLSESALYGKLFMSLNNWMKEIHQKKLCRQI